VGSVLMKHLSSLVGAIVTLGGLLSLLSSDSVKMWVKTHSYLVFVLLVLSVASAFLIIAGQSSLY
jgi:hypothetical protein